MSILNALKQQHSSIDDLAKLPQAMIMQMAQKKEISPEMVAPILSRKAEMMEAVSRSKALQQPAMQPTVMERLMSQNIQTELAPQIPGQMPQQVAPPQMPPQIPPQMSPPMPQEAGVAQLPIPERQYAGGGIIAFAKGDLIDDESDDEDILAEYAAAMEAGRRASNYELKAPQQVPQQRVSQQSQQYGMAYAEPLPKVSGINYKGGKHPYDEMVMAEAEKQGVDPRLASFILNKETGGMKNPEAARSRAGAMGIAQFMPATAKQYNINPDIPSEAAYGMNKHLKYLVNKYEDPKVAAIAYNWGEGNTNKWLKAGADMSKLPKETRNYVATLAKGGEVKHFANDGYVGFGQEVPYDPNEPSIYDTLGSMVGSPLERLKNSIYGFGLTTDKDISRQQKSKTVPTSKADKTDARKSTDRADVRRSEERIAQKPEALAQAGLTPEEMAAGSTRAGTFEAMNRDATTGVSIPKAAIAPNQFDTFMEEIAAQRENLAAQRGEDRNMALLAAGLGMMGGTSPYAFANVGQGGLSGMQYLSEANKARAAEKAALDKNQVAAMRYKDLGNIAAGDKAAMLAIRQGELTVKQNELTEKQRLHNMSSLGQLQKMSEAKAQAALKTQGILGVENINDPQMQKQLSDWVEQDLAKNKAYNKLYQETYGFPYDVTPTTTSGGNVMKFDKKGNLVK